MSIESPLAAAVRTDFDPQVLACIHDQEVELALWHRRLPWGLVRWLEELPAAHLPGARLSLDVASAAPALDAAFDASGTPPCVWRDVLRDDIVQIATRLARVIGGERVQLRLEAVTDNACRRLHRDCVPLRLLTTYHGPGTEWVVPEFADFALASPDGYDGPMERLSAGSVALFKGCGFPGQLHERGIVHRSPPIAGSGITRLVLCLNVPPGGAAP